LGNSDLVYESKKRLGSETDEKAAYLRQGGADAHDGGEASGQPGDPVCAKHISRASLKKHTANCYRSRYSFDISGDRSCQGPKIPGNNLQWLRRRGKYIPASPATSGDIITGSETDESSIVPGRSGRA
jgi:hypothetical protein